ncbi:hypothetical protein ZHAS_00011612 [Anopheles sinensis]|uniref:Uncharacterized protein n=1 Tax=Anopheles sinensis TaxID=74873 RepID=A0A084W0Y5_ANOSI|nr:hypothetical protein ZHAS_00011612 [Anopheles sinensis]
MTEEHRTGLSRSGTFNRAAFALNNFFSRTGNYRVETWSDLATIDNNDSEVRNYFVRI